MSHDAGQCPVTRIMETPQSRSPNATFPTSPGKILADSRREFIGAYVISGYHRRDKSRRRGPIPVRFLFWSGVGAEGLEPPTC